MSTCKTLIRLSLPFSTRSFSLLSLRPSNYSPLNFIPSPFGVRARNYASIGAASIPLESTGIVEDSPENATTDLVEQLLANRDDVTGLMKMERRCSFTDDSEEKAEDLSMKRRWFPYLDRLRSGSYFLTSSEVLEAVEPLIMDVRKERFRSVVKNRTYSVCLVVEGLADFGNVSAVFRSADALGFQSVHVVSCDSSKRYRDNRHVSMGAEKWLDIELWDSTKECFETLKSRGYRIATTHLGMDAVSVYEMDWSCPTAIVVGNENRGISDEALKLSDLHCSIPMKGMVDSFNVSVAAGILMHHAVCDRTSRLGCHGDLTSEERQILLAEFSLRHSKSAISVAHDYAKRKAAVSAPAHFSRDHIFDV
ncbi:hypothetical protein HS088_TW23G00108 [Tripterygium wilfordii]|uniref:tRNA/rRNA methyltransferase SpoU type domain-containing protein n=1 Tax=Tripterygium wilfordii TaxID=458696 RepID=A0A7J7BV13_TRIWF|nr:tRNA (guanosine(18)-2'-O)-methyltransferase [Tripterygium wilfordii]KAF5725386.1 hypothetical protein HS088_TW23G00108 [Tripterygium wilfordii]